MAGSPALEPRSDVDTQDLGFRRRFLGRGRKRPNSGFARPRLSGFQRYILRRLILAPAQLIFVLLVLYVFIDIPITLTTGPPESFLGTLQGFYQTLANDVTGNWGYADFLRFHLPWTQVYAYYIPPSIQLAAFALPIAAALAYPVSLLAGWSRRPGLDEPARFLTLTGALLPVFVVGTLVVNAVFFGYLGWLQDVPNQGLIPTAPWFLNRGGYPSWIIYDAVTQPTGFPLIDAVFHRAWDVAFISLTKTLLQAFVVAIAYVAIFFRHARSIVRSVSEEPHIVGARSRGVSERTLLWRHTARQVTPSFLLVFALTIPEYLGVQFAVEVAFSDQAGFGNLVFAELTGGILANLEPLVFLLAILVLAWTFVVDIIAIRLDPRGRLTR
ncbi:MAG: ABC transporter permease subunit [Thermoplasmata archaeon]|jgi:ABC-type dipeptide/oligopeptide/nickel transport system permease component